MKPLRPADVARAMSTAAVQWYIAGFRAGVAGVGPKARKGQPRRRAMRTAWREGITDGWFALAMFSGQFARKGGDK